MGGGERAKDSGRFQASSGRENGAAHELVDGLVRSAPSAQLREAVRRSHVPLGRREVSAVAGEGHRFFPHPSLAAQLPRSDEVQGSSCSRHCRQHGRVHLLESVDDSRAAHLVAALHDSQLPAHPCVWTHVYTANVLFLVSRGNVRGPSQAAVNPDRPPFQPPWRTTLSLQQRCNVVLWSRRAFLPCLLLRLPIVEQPHTRSLHHATLSRLFRHRRCIQCSRLTPVDRSPLPICRLETWDEHGQAGSGEDWRSRE